MRELNKNYMYDLSDITEVQWQLLIPILHKKSERKFKYDTLKVNFRDGFKIIHFNSHEQSWAFSLVIDKEVKNAKELFYTLENIQVDCRRLTREQIKEVAKISGYKKGNLECYQHYNYFRIAYDTCNVGVYEESKNTITYEKFMELFGRKEENFKKLVEVLNEELTEEAYKGTEYEVKYIAEKPKQYQIGIDTFERCEANMTKEEILACVKFGIDKYVWRNKGQDLEDLEKIISYANWGIKQLKQQ